MSLHLRVENEEQYLGISFRWMGWYVYRVGWSRAQDMDICLFAEAEIYYNNEPFVVSIFRQTFLFLILSLPSLAIHCIRFNMMVGDREQMVVYIEVRQDICMMWRKPFVPIAQPHFLYSLPEGGLTSTLPLPTSSQLVLRAVPPLSV